MPSAAERLALIREKIERAKKHIGDLDNERASFLALNPYLVTPEYYAEYNATAYFLDECPPIPNSIALMAGDAIHNLRSALDHLFFQLIEANGKTPIIEDYPGFPILKSKERFDKYVAANCAQKKGTSGKAENLIQATKAYQGGNDTLWSLQELDNIDKHRLLITAVFAINKFGFDIGGRNLERMTANMAIRIVGELPPKIAWFSAPDRKIGAKKGDVIFSIEGDFETNKNVQFTFDIAFGEPEIVKGKPLLETLQQMSDFVDALICSFLPCLG